MKALTLTPSHLNRVLIAEMTIFGESTVRNFLLFATDDDCLGQFVVPSAYLLTLSHDGYGEAFLAELLLAHSIECMNLEWTS